MSRLASTCSVLLVMLTPWVLPRPAVAQTNLNPTAEQLATAMDIPAGTATSVALVESPGQAARGVVANFGSVLVPLAGANMIALSSGEARTPAMPGYTSGRDWGTGPFTLPVEAPSAPGCPSAGEVRDLTEFRIELIVPAGMIGFRFDHNFLAWDYPEYVCSSYSDGFLAVVQSPTVGTANVAFDSMTNPITLNTAFWMAGAPSGIHDPPMGTAPLAGTGFETGGATMWNTTSVPAVGGEAVVLRIFIYDAGDGIGDSTVLLDNFQWIPSPTDAPVVNAGPDQTVSTLGGSASVTLGGSATDPEGGSVIYVWSWAGGSTTGATPTVTLPVGTHVLTLTAYDLDGGAAADTVTITVLDGTPSLGDTIAGLLASVSTQGATLASHDATIAALQATVATLSSTITTLQATVVSLQGSLNTQGSALTGAQARIAALEQQILTMQTQVLGILKHPIMNSVPQAGPKK